MIKIMTSKKMTHFQGIVGLKHPGGGKDIGQKACFSNRIKDTTSRRPLQTDLFNCALNLLDAFLQIACVADGNAQQARGKLHLSLRFL